MPEESRGGFAFFGSNNWWIWIIVIFIILLLCNPGFFGSYGYCKD